MLIVGLTGGIGSGKTVASDHFKSLGISIVDADEVSRLVVEPGTPALLQIAAHFGEEILTEDKALDRRKLREIVFNKPEEKRWLESLLHPLIGMETARQLQSSLSPYTIFVSPLLIEIGQYLMTQRILVIDTPEETQVARTVARDDTDSEGVEAIIKTQASRQQRLEKADDVIVNNGSLDALKKEVEALHQHYLTLAEGA
ncbi:MAG: dephospho-CoA kinase [Gammaproteobacteria bacterium]|nr:dephospho-CoA kinase [Gammaproteobacteria bacterium]